MRKVWALMRASALSAASYRVAFLTGLAGTLATALPIFFVTRALQPTMAETIAGEGSSYFGFVILGLLAATWMQFGTSSLGDALLGSVRSGTLEAFFATPTRLPVILTGLIGYPFLMAMVRSFAMLATAAAFGVQFHWSALPLVLALLVLVAIAYVPVSLVTASLVLTVRTAGPIATGVSFVSFLLGGVYYPTRVIPSWFRDLAEIVPLAPGLRAMRRLFLDGASLAAVADDIGRLVLLAAALLAVTTPILLAALHQARRTGSLAQP